MNLNTGYFPPYNHRRKQTAAGYHMPLNNQQHRHAVSLQSARSSLDSANGNESFLPPVFTINGSKDSHRPYHQNDFANNHLFIAKRKLARIFLGEPTRNLQATSDLIHLFDRQAPRLLDRNLNKYKRQENVSNNKSLSSTEQDAHLSVVNLVVKPPFPSIQTRDPQSAIIRRHRSQAVNFLPKAPRSLNDAMNPPVKQHLNSAALHALSDDIEVDELIDNDNISDTISTTINPFDTSLLCVKSIIPSAGPQHTNHHLLQHR